MATPEPDPTPDVPVVHLMSVARTYQAGAVDVPALKEATLRIDHGEYVSIVGPSGSGKSTLLNIIGLLDRPTDGTYLFEGTDVGTLKEGARTRLRGSRIGFVFQAFHLLPHRSVLENVALAMLYGETDRKDREERAREALDRVGLSHRIEFKPVQLSGGERQRVAIARAIVGRPSLLLCDEPTGNLDTVNSTTILGLFEELRRDGLTLVIITHDQDVSRHAERRVSITDGTLTALGMR
ncbi:MAG: ABC transporter ATP-binding protein [Acidimicrobiia bacterium]